MIKNLFQDGQINERPKYRKIGNKNLYLAFSKIVDEHYPVPWTMWAGPSTKPGDYIGNIKIASENSKCPVEPKVLGSI